MDTKKAATSVAERPMLSQNAAFEGAMSTSRTLPSITATQEFVVPRSIPIISFPDAPLTALRLRDAMHQHHSTQAQAFETPSQTYASECIHWASRHLKGLNALKPTLADVDGPAHDAFTCYRQSVRQYKFNRIDKDTPRELSSPKLLDLAPCK